MLPAAPVSGCCVRQNIATAYAANGTARNQFNLTANVFIGVQSFRNVQVLWKTYKISMEV